MSEQRQKEIQELLKKHSEHQKQNPQPTQNTPSGNISISDITGNNNNIFINSYVEMQLAKKN